jgi:hypothetical protein
MTAADGVGGARSRYIYCTQELHTASFINNDVKLSSKAPQSLQKSNCIKQALYQVPHGVTTHPTKSAPLV